MRTILALTVLALICCAVTPLPAAIPPPSNPGPDYEFWTVTCFEGSNEVVYEVIAWTPPTAMFGAWRFTMRDFSRLVTSAPCKLNPVGELEAETHARRLGSPRALPLLQQAKAFDEDVVERELQAKVFNWLETVDLNGIVFHVPNDRKLDRFEAARLKRLGVLRGVADLAVMRADGRTSWLEGQLKHARALSAVVAPTVNSYKRLVPGYEAPVYVGWAQINRSALTRIPRYTTGRDKSMRAELRCPDPSTNPYLAFTVMLAAALDGIDNAMTAPEPLNNVNVYHLTADERAEREHR